MQMSLFSPFEVSFLGNISHLRKEDRKQSAPNSLEIQHGLSASLPSLTYLSLPNRQCLTEIPSVGSLVTLLADWVIFKIVFFLEQDH